MDLFAFLIIHSLLCITLCTSFHKQTCSAEIMPLSWKWRKYHQFLFYSKNHKFRCETLFRRGAFSGCTVICCRRNWLCAGSPYRCVDCA